MLLKDIERVLQDQKLINKVVYDLDIERDVAIATGSSNTESSASELSRCSTGFVFKFLVYKIVQ